LRFVMGDKFRGVYVHKDSGWTATLGRQYLGWFREHAQAVSARIAAEIEQTGSAYDVREPVIDGDTVLIPLHGRRGVFYGYSRIDLADYELVRPTAWTLDRKGYAVGRPAGASNAVPMHRLIVYGLEVGGVTDHVSGDKLDNRRCNLRRCTTKENTRNTRLAKNNTSGKKGVRETACGMWQARITVDREEIHLGNYASKELAAAAYDEACKKLHGLFASPNQ
jgi:hypothetical protein